MQDELKAERDLLFNRKFSFSSEYKISVNEGFNKVLQGKVVVFNNYKVHFISNNKAHARLGIIVRKRIFPSSVRRNHLKRLIRESFRKHDVTLCSMDLIVITRSSAIFDKNEPSNALDILFSKVKDLCASC